MARFDYQSLIAQLSADGFDSGEFVRQLVQRGYQELIDAGAQAHIGAAPHERTSTRQIRDFIDPSHLLIKIDESFDFAELAAPLEEKYPRDGGRAAIHPALMIRALLISSLYDITSYRRLVHPISENIAFRWHSPDDASTQHAT